MVTNLLTPFLLIIISNNVWAEFCATLFKEGNQTGRKYSMLDDSYVINFGEQYISVDSVWNSTSSISIEKGCVLTACNDTNFDGDCREFSRSLDLLPKGFSTILSASCTCSHECSCSDVHMRRTNCAHGYLGEGCNVCNPMYADLRGEKSLFFYDSVTAIKVRSGCELTIFSEEGYEGDESYVTGTINPWVGDIGSYTCSCKSDEVASTKPPRLSNDPDLVNVPYYSIQNVSLMVNGDFKRHPGLLAGLESLKNKRSSKNAYILAIGSTGAGKSSAINLLFDNPNVTRVGGTTSTTTDIHEFRINVPVDELGIKNSELRIIDTPGLMDTRGLTQDAMFLATLDEYLSNHEDLHERIPNVVLIFHKFNDNRFAGEGSSFVKMLRGLDAFRTRITDDNYSNVIFVFSHLMSEEKANHMRPTTRLLRFKNAIEEYSLFPKPIVTVVAENKPLENGLPSVNGYYKLPNGDFYPRNLFEKIQDATSKGGDPIGNAVIRTAFRDPDNFNISSITFKLVESGNNKISKYYNILSNIVLNIEDTEISKMLAAAHEKMNITLKTKFPESLKLMQKALNIRNLRAKTDIPQTTLGILRLLSHLRLNEANTFLLEEGLKIKPPIFGHNIPTGHSYNIFKDIPLPNSPLELGENIHSDIGYLFPSAMTCNIENQISDFVKFFPTKAEYINDRINSLGVQGKINEDRFSGETKPGFNIESEAFRNDSCEITAVREFRLFQLNLNDRPRLTGSFDSALEALPVFNSTDWDNVKMWKDFFDKYGTHVVSSVYGGGAIDIHLTSSSYCGSEIAKSLLDVIQFAEDLTAINGNSSALLQTGIEHVLKFRGGDQAYHAVDLTKMTLDDASRLMSNWKKSLLLNPIILSSEIKLLPISIVAKKVGQNLNISSEIERATFLLFNSTLRYTPPTNPPADSRGETPTVGVNETIFKNILAQYEAESKRFETIISDMKQQQSESDKKREAQIQEEIEWRRRQEEERRQESRIAREERNRIEEENRRAMADYYHKQKQNDLLNEISLLECRNLVEEHNFQYTQLLYDIKTKLPPGQKRKLRRLGHPV